VLASQEESKVTQKEWLGWARTFGVEFTALYSDEDVTPYLHVFVYHIGYFLETYQKKKKKKKKKKNLITLDMALLRYLQTLQLRAECATTSVLLLQQQMGSAIPSQSNRFVPAGELIDTILNIHLINKIKKLEQHGQHVSSKK
jgi:hypothetical protein